MQRAENSFRVVMFVISEVCVFLTSDKQIGLSSMIVNELRGRLNFPEGKVSVKIYFLNNLKEYLNKQKKINLSLFNPSHDLFVELSFSN